MYSMTCRECSTDWKATKHPVHRHVPHYAAQTQRRENGKLIATEFRGPGSSGSSSGGGQQILEAVSEKIMSLCIEDVRLSAEKAHRDDQDGAHGEFQKSSNLTKRDSSEDESLCSCRYGNDAYEEHAVYCRGGQVPQGKGWKARSSYDCEVREDECENDEDECVIFSRSLCLNDKVRREHDETRCVLFLLLKRIFLAAFASRGTWLQFSECGFPPWENLLKFVFVTGHTYVLAIKNKIVTDCAALC